MAIASAIVAGLSTALAVAGKVAAIGGAIAGPATSISQAQESKAMRKRLEGQAQSGIAKVNPMTREQLLAGSQSVLSSSNTATSAGRGRLLGN